MQGKGKDDDFGDFLQGPTVAVGTDQQDKMNALAALQKTSAATIPEHMPDKQEQMKDLKSIMLEYSDLSAPKKAKGFHKPTLSEVQKSVHKHQSSNTINFSESNHSKCWKQNTEEFEGLFQISAPEQPTNNLISQTHNLAYGFQHTMTAGLPPVGASVFPSANMDITSPILQSNNTSLATSMYFSTAVTRPGPADLIPHSNTPFSLPGWCFHNEDQLPTVYKQVFETSLFESQISTSRLYPLLLLSGLPREKLAQIWSLCNTTTPGQLVKQELWLVLALIALTQNNYNTFSLDILARCPVAPVPVLMQVQDINAQWPTTPQQYQSPVLHQTPTCYDASLIYPFCQETVASANDEGFTDVQHAMATTRSTAVSFDKDALSSNDELPTREKGSNGTFRVLNLDNETAQSTLFEDQGHTSTNMIISNHNKQQKTEVLDNEEDDWADFLAAPSISEDMAHLNSALASVSQAATSLVPKTSLGLNFGDINLLCTPSKAKGLDSTLFEAHPLYNTLNGQDILITDLEWNKSITYSDVNLANISSDSNGDRLYYIKNNVGQSGSPNNTDVNELKTSRMSVSARLTDTSLEYSSVQSNTNSTAEVENELAHFVHNITLMSSNVTLEELSDFAMEKYYQNKVPHLNPVIKADEEDVWCDYNAADAWDGTIRDCESDLDNDNVETIGSSESFVTIKKYSLGTSETIGLLKVGGEPATLSSFQLPQNQRPSNEYASGQIRGSCHSSANRSNVDDDAGSPLVDFDHDEKYDDFVFSRRYRLVDFIQQAQPPIIKSLSGNNHADPLYSQLKDSKKDNGPVHSLDLPLSRAIESSDINSHSVSSMDLTSSVELIDCITGVIASDSKSISIRSELGDCEGSHQGNSQDGPASISLHSQQSIQPQELLASMPDIADKYKIEREAQGIDRYGCEWEHCLRNCCHVISEANRLFNTISSSSVCNEILKSAQGSEYIRSVIEIYRIVCRILTSMRSTAISTTELEQTFKNIDLAWNNLTAFLAGASLLPKQASLVFTHCIIKSGSDNAQDLACGVCLLNVDAIPVISSPHSGDGNNCKLTYAGRQYHASCANLWLNCVNQTLPSLTLPDLL